MDEEIKKGCLWVQEADKEDRGQRSEANGLVYGNRFAAPRILQNDLEGIHRALLFGRILYK